MRRWTGGAAARGELQAQRRTANGTGTFIHPNHLPAASRRPPTTYNEIPTAHAVHATGLNGQRRRAGGIAHSAPCKSDRRPLVVSAVPTAQTAQARWMKPPPPPTAARNSIIAGRRLVVSAKASRPLQHPQREREAQIPSAESLTNNAPVGGTPAAVTVEAQVAVGRSLEEVFAQSLLSPCHQSMPPAAAPASRAMGDEPLLSRTSEPAAAAASRKKNVNAASRSRIVVNAPRFRVRSGSYGGAGGASPVGLAPRQQLTAASRGGGAALNERDGGEGEGVCIFSPPRWGSFASAVGGRIGPHPPPPQRATPSACINIGNENREEGASQQQEPRSVPPPPQPVDSSSRHSPFGDSCDMPPPDALTNARTAGNQNPWGEDNKYAGIVSLRGKTTRAATAATAARRAGNTKAAPVMMRARPSSQRHQDEHHHRHDDGGGRSSLLMNGSTTPTCMNNAPKSSSIGAYLRSNREEKAGAASYSHGAPRQPRPQGGTAAAAAHRKKQRSDYHHHPLPPTATTHNSTTAPPPHNDNSTTTAYAHKYKSFDHPPIPQLVSGHAAPKTLTGARVLRMKKGGVVGVGGDTHDDPRAAIASNNTWKGSGSGSSCRVLSAPPPTATARMSTAVALHPAGHHQIPPPHMQQQFHHVDAVAAVGEPPQQQHGRHGSGVDNGVLQNPFYLRNRNDANHGLLQSSSFSLAQAFTVECPAAEEPFRVPPHFLPTTTSTNTASSSSDYHHYHQYDGHRGSGSDAMHGGGGGWAGAASPFAFRGSGPQQQQQQAPSPPPHHQLIGRESGGAYTVDTSPDGANGHVPHQHHHQYQYIFSPSPFEERIQQQQHQQEQRQRPSGAAMLLNNHNQGKHANAAAANAAFGGFSAPVAGAFGDYFLSSPPPPPHMLEKDATTYLPSPARCFHPSPPLSTRQDHLPSPPPPPIHQHQPYAYSHNNPYYLPTPSALNGNNHPLPLPPHQQQQQLFSGNPFLTLATASPLSTSHLLPPAASPYSPTRNAAAEELIALLDHFQ